MSNRQDKEREAELQPKRMEFAKQSIQDLGYEIVVEKATSLTFMFKGEFVTIFPYSGWHSGKSIKDGRGLQNLLNQLTNNN